MARLTVEDCLEHLDNRYDLVLLAAKRARQLALGSDAMVDEEGDKPTVVALREIAAGVVRPDNIDSIARPTIDEDLVNLDFPPLPETPEPPL